MSDLDTDMVCAFSHRDMFNEQFSNLYDEESTIVLAGGFLKPEYMKDLDRINNERGRLFELWSKEDKRIRAMLDSNPCETLPS